MHTLTIEELPSHSHPFSSLSTVGGGCGLEGSHSQLQKNDIQTGAIGGSKPHNNMPPYVALTYYKRS